MQYQFTYRNTPGDYWRFYMSNIYHQWTAIVNIVFTVAAFALLIARFWDAHPVLQAIMLLLCSVFPVIQPLVIFLRARQQANAIKVETTLTMDDGGFGIQVKAHRQRILWKDFRGVTRRWGLMVLMPDDRHVYLLPDRVVGEQRDAVYRDVRVAVERYRNGREP